MQIVGNSSNRKFFLESIAKLGDPEEEGYKLKLRPSKFRALVHILKKTVNGELPIEISS